MSPVLSFWCPVHSGLRQHISRIIAQLVHRFGMLFLARFGPMEATHLSQLLCLLPEGCAWLNAHQMPREPTQTFLGHSTLETTQVYAESSTAMMRESDQRAVGR